MNCKCILLGMSSFQLVRCLQNQLTATASYTMGPRFYSKPVVYVDTDLVVIISVFLSRRYFLILHNINTS